MTLSDFKERRPSQQNISQSIHDILPGPCPSSGPSLRLIPATPVDINLSPPSANKLASSEFSSDKGRSNSTNTTSVLSNASMLRTPSAKSRRSSKSSYKTEKKSKGSTSFGNLSGYSFKTQSSEKETSENRSDSKSKSSISAKRSIRLLKKKSFKVEHDEIKMESGSDTNIRKVAVKNSFYKVLDKIRGVSRRSSLRSGGESSGGGGGQQEFLASISRMSDSRIVENWLLSIEDRVKTSTIHTRRWGI